MFEGEKETSENSTSLKERCYPWTLGTEARELAESFGLAFQSAFARTPPGKSVKNHNLSSSQLTLFREVILQHSLWNDWS
ncbi:hypothetical protein V9T40_000069 [Parthenolecanium corni]|uniref:Uncharacterized protein n=1 Tax=Parthenolecanium corni TaxID=536013 RepID=A0AAN9Y472_9HEMI